MDIDEEVAEQLCLERIVLPPESARGCGSCVFSSLIKTSGWWIRGQTGTFDPPPPRPFSYRLTAQGEDPAEETYSTRGRSCSAPDDCLAAQL
jgi:hypothetical protein